MGVLSEFKNFEEKKLIATHIVIKTKNEFDHYFDQFNKSGSIWRGLSESKFRLYTSLQRFWINEDLPNDIELVKKYLKTILDYSNKWNLDCLRKYLRNYGINDFTPYSVLSVLRHHGTPTPILDWSRNPHIALFFGAEYTIPEEGESEISNYFSLYEMKPDHVYKKLEQKNSTFDFWKTREHELRTFNKIKDGEDEDFLKNFYQGFLNSDELFFKDITHSPILMIEDLPNDEFQYYINNNYNITNQEGLFVLNISPDLPLELAIWERMEQIGAVRDESKEVIKKAFLEKHMNNFFCYDIHKSLRHYVLEKLNSVGINKSYVYPDLKELAESCVQEFMKKL
ncbi:MAG: FRG domain-containing protein [Reichenbachiella sp.]|uniref:FRG domain-containing protein n=1 Tax=Reichenbachiella sp. TaxID=2184521 RepID=UPI003299B905